MTSCLLQFSLVMAEIACLFTVVLGDDRLFVTVVLGDNKDDPMTRRRERRRYGRPYGGKRRPHHYPGQNGQWDAWVLARLLPSRFSGER